MGYSLNDVKMVELIQKKKMGSSGQGWGEGTNARPGKLGEGK